MIVVVVAVAVERFFPKLSGCIKTSNSAKFDTECYTIKEQRKVCFLRRGWFVKIK